MAAVYLQDDLFSGTSSESRNIQEHTRNISTISSVTLVTNTTVHSHPSEPLLPTELPNASTQAPSYYIPAPYPPHTVAGTSQLRWGDLPAHNHDPNSLNEKNRWEGIRRESRRWQRVTRLILDVIIVVWSIYNVVRYFISFTIYDGNATEGQSLSLSLGTSASVALALILVAKSLFLIKHRLRLSTQTFRYLTRTSCVLRVLSSLCILAPAVTNFVLLFLWRNSSNPHYNISHRCHTAAIDIIWSVSRNPCTGKSSSWGIWLTASSVRFAFTVAALVIYHVLSFMHSDYPRRPLHHRLRSESYISTPTAGADRLSSAAVMPTKTLAENGEPSARHQVSGTTLADSYRPPSRMSRARSHSSDISNVTMTPTKSLRSGNKPSPPTTDDDHPNFQSMLNQISQETDAALNFAASDHAPSPESIRNHGPSPTPSHPPGLQSSYMTHEHYEHYASDDDDDNDNRYDARHHGDPDAIYQYNLPPITPVLGYNEFGLPYPPDQAMRMLNGFIRRMPTIESMGSGELATSIAASTRAGGSMYTSSRPPTRNTLLSFTSSIEQAEGATTPPPSRPNSLSARAELLAGMSNAPSAHPGASEHGELLVGPDSAQRWVPSPTSYLEVPEAADTLSSNGSRGTAGSYHTATMNSGDSYTTSMRSPS